MQVRCIAVRDGDHADRAAIRNTKRCLGAQSTICIGTCDLPGIRSGKQRIDGGAEVGSFKLQPRYMFEYARCLTDHRFLGCRCLFDGEGEIEALSHLVGVEIYLKAAGAQVKTDITGRLKCQRARHLAPKDNI